MKTQKKRRITLGLLLVSVVSLLACYCVSRRNFEILYEGGAIRAVTGWRLLGYKVGTQNDIYDLNGQHLENSFTFDTSLFYPRSSQYTKRFQRLSRKSERPISSYFDFASPAVIRRCTPGLNPYGEEIAVEGSGKLWMLPNSDLLLFGENETQLLRIEGKRCQKLSELAQSPEFAESQSEIIQVDELMGDRVLVARDEEWRDQLDYGRLYRFEYYTDYYTFKDDKLELIASWKLRMPDNGSAITQVVADKLVYLDDKDENLVFRRIDNAEIIQELRLPIVGGEVDYFLTPLGFMRELVFDGWKKRVLSSTDLSEIPELPIANVPPGEYRLEYWDHPNETAWFSSKEHVVGFRRSDQTIIGPIESPFRIVSTEYLEDRHSLLLLGDRPKRWAFVDLTAHELTKP